MRNFICGLIVGVILIIGTIAFAEFIVSENQFPILVNGEQQDIESFIINDRTFLPLRALGDILGVSVDFREGIILVDTNITNENVDEVANDERQFTSDGLPLWDNGGVYMGFISAILNRIGTGHMIISPISGDDGTTYTIYLRGEPQLENIARIPRTNEIPLDFYEEVLRPFIESLTE